MVEQDLGTTGGYRFAGHAWSGVYRQVWIEKRPSTWIRSAWVRLDGDDIAIEAELGGAVETAAAATAEIRVAGTGAVLVGPMDLTLGSTAGPASVVLRLR